MDQGEGEMRAAASAAAEALRGRGAAPPRRARRTAGARPSQAAPIASATQGRPSSTSLLRVGRAFESQPAIW